MEVTDARWKYWRSYYPVLEGLFYVFQGLYLTALSVYQSVFMTKVWALPYTTIAMLSSVLMIPGYLKSFTGLLSDRVPWGRFGRRRPYILIGAIAYLPCFVLLASIKEFGLPWMAMIILATWVWVLVDGTLDALTVDVTPPEKMGLMQGTAWGCRGIGAAIGSVMITQVGLKYGWATGIYLIGGLASLMAVSGLFMREPPVRKEVLPGIRDFKETFSKRRTWVGFAYTILYFASNGMMMIFAPFMLRNVGISVADLGIVMAAVQIGNFIGCMVVGRASDAFGAKKIGYGISVVFWCGLALWMTLSSGASWTWILAVSAVYGFVSGGLTVPMLRIIMELSPPTLGGFMFATYASAANFGAATVGALTIGHFVPMLGLPMAIFTLIPYTIVGCILLPFTEPWAPSKGSSEEPP